MAKRFYFTNENGDNIGNDHIGNIRGAKTVAKRLANELNCEVCINDCETEDMLDFVYPDKHSKETAEQEVETATEKTEQATENTDILPCPFCGIDLQKFPQVMVVNRAYNEDYLKWLHENKKFVGSDRDYQVSCVKCGSTGARGATKSIAVSKWNRRNSGQAPPEIS